MLSLMESGHSPPRVVTVAGSVRGCLDSSVSLAQFDTPVGVTIDLAGNILVADSANARIRCISTKGLVSTIAQLTFRPMYITADRTGTD